MPKLEVKNLCKKNGQFSLKDISFKVEDGAFLSILGATGSGKTTLLRCLAGLEEIDSGEILIDDINTPANKRNIAMIFQDAALFPHTKVKHNIAYGLHHLGYKSKEIDEKVLEVAKLLRIDSLLERYPVSLSGGEKQRVGIARALIREPKILLLDEPFASIDERLKDNLLQELKNIQKAKNILMIQVTHDQREAMLMADNILIIKDGEIVSIGSPLSLYDNPPNIYTAEFIGRPEINTLASEIKDHKIALLNTTLNIHESINDQVVMVGIRAEDIIINERGHYSGVVTSKEKDGYDYIYAVETEFGKFMVRSNEDVSEGERIFMSIRKSKIHLFNIVTGNNLNNNGASV